MTDQERRRDRRDRPGTRCDEVNRLLEPRQERILLAVIREYVETAEPVGSASLLQKYNLGCSSATIRNEMARLEELGFLAQPHTSAGRLPLDKAYRYYVDRLLEKRIVPPPEASEIARDFQDIDRELAALLDHARRRLSQLTRYTSVVLGPRLGRSLFKYLQLIKTAPRQVLLIMMTHAGTIVHRVIDLSMDLDPHDLDRLTNMLNDRLLGMSMDRINIDFLRGLPQPLEPEILERVSQVTQELAREYEHRVYFEGASNLLDQPEFRDAYKARGLLEVLEQESMLAEILDKSLPRDGVAVVIGGEHLLSQMRECTMVTATYCVGGLPIGSIGVIGPMRLHYDRVISIVKCVADVFGRRLTEARNP